MNKDSSFIFIFLKWGILSHQIEDSQETPNVEGKVKNIYLRFGNVKLNSSLLKIRGVGSGPVI